MYYHGARYYAPWLGRWTTTDPAGLIDALNLYEYSRSNPISFRDPTGLQGRKVVLSHHFTGTETVDELHKFARDRGYDFEGTPKWTGTSWDVGTLHKIAPGNTRGGAKAAVAGGGGGGAAAAGSSQGKPTASGTGAGGGGGGSSTLKSFGTGFLKGLVLGIAAGLVIGAMIASGGTLAIIGGALAVGGAFLGGVTLGQVITGETITGKKLTDEQRAEMGGELLGGTLGGALGGGISSRAVPEGAVPSETPITNDIIGKPRVGSALKNDVPKPTELPVDNYGRPSVREFGPQVKGHGWPDMIDNYAGDATKFDLSNGAKLYQIDGSLNGKPGRFEWITQNGNVTHRQFIPGGRITGTPIRK